MENETWLPVPSRPGVTASSLGRVKLPDVRYYSNYGGVITRQTKPVLGSVCRASKNAKHAYRNLYNKKLGHMKVHRLVCEAFHGKPPSGKSVVIHIDENALNNRPENLRWGTQKENLNMPGFLSYCRGRTGENSPFIKGMKRKRLKIAA
jgi:hypothetical protein